MKRKDFMQDTLENVFDVIFSGRSALFLGAKRWTLQFLRLMT